MFCYHTHGATGYCVVTLCHRPISEGDRPQSHSSATKCASYCDIPFVILLLPLRPKSIFSSFSVVIFVYVLTCVIPRSVIASSVASRCLRLLIMCNWSELITGQSSDSEDLPTIDSSSKCTPVKHLSLSKPQKLARSPARVSPHIKDGEKEKHREKHPNSSPRTYKWSFQLSKNLPDSLTIL